MISEKQLLANRQNALRSTGPRTVAGKEVASKNATRHGLRAESTVIPGEDPAEFNRFRDQLFEEFAPVGVLESRLTARIAGALWKFQRVDKMENDLLTHLQDAHDRQQHEYAERVIAAAKRIADAKSLAAELRAAAETPVHHVSFEEAQKQWLSTDDGMAFNENRWPGDHDYPKPMQAFKRFWSELDQKAQPQIKAQPQSPQAPADNSPAEHQRTDLSYQVMLEQRQRMAPLQQPDQKTLPAADSALPPKDASVPIEPNPWGPALVKDFTGSNIMLKFSRYKTQSERSLYRALNELNKLQYLRKRSEAIDVQDTEGMPN